MQYFMAYNHHIYKAKICGLELFIRMQYFMAYNHHIYKPKIGVLELCKFYSQLQNTCNRAHRRLFLCILVQRAWCNFQRTWKQTARKKKFK